MTKLTLSSHAQKLLKGSFIRFALVGVANTIVGMGITFLLFYLFNLSHNWAYIIGQFLGATMSYFLNRSFTFKHKDSMLKSLPKFALVVIVCTLFSSLVGNIIDNTIIAKYSTLSDKVEGNITILISSGIYIITNYFGQKLFAFRKNKEG